MSAVRKEGSKRGSLHVKVIRGGGKTTVKEGRIVSPKAATAKTRRVISESSRDNAEALERLKDR